MRTEGEDRWLRKDFTSRIRERNRVNLTLTLFRMGLFWAAHGWGNRATVLLPKIFDTYPAITFGTGIPYLKKIQKIFQSHDIHFELC